MIRKRLIEASAWGLLLATGCSRSGDASTDPVVVSAPSTAGASVAFGAVTCGASDQREVTVALPASAKSWRVGSIEPASVFSVEGATSGTGSSATIKVATTVPIGTVRPGDYVSGFVRIVVDDLAGKTLDVPLSVEPHGAWIEAPSQFDFGVVNEYGKRIEGSVPLRNAGNEPVAVRVVPASSPFTMADGARVIEPGETSGWSASFAPTEAGDATAVATIAIVDGVDCSGRAAQGIGLAGHARLTPLELSAASLDFGTSVCGEARTPQQVQITNHSNQRVDWTATVDNTAAYKVTPAIGQLPANLSITLTVTPLADAGGSIGANALDDVLTIGIGNGQSMPVPLRRGVSGAVLRWGASALDLGRNRLDTGLARSVPLYNEGDLPITLRASVSDAQLTTASTSFTVPAGGVVNVPVGATMTDFSVVDSLSVHVDGDASALCRGGVDPVSIRGRGYTRATDLWGLYALVDGGRVLLVAPYQTGTFAPELQGATALVRAYPGGYDEMCVRVANNSDLVCRLGGFSWASIPGTSDTLATLKMPLDGIDLDATFRCYASSTALRCEDSPISTAGASGVRKYIAAWAGCVVRKDLECWQRNFSPIDFASRFDTRVTVLANVKDATLYSWNTVLAVREDGTAAYTVDPSVFSTSNAVVWTDMPGITDAVSVVESSGCVVRANGRIACLGSDSYVRNAFPLQPADSVVDLGLADVVEANFSCARHSDGRVTCWSGDPVIPPTPLPGLD